MSKRIVGLVGRGKGPRIFIGRDATAIHAEVRGLPTEHVVEVHCHHHEGRSTHVVGCDGEIELPLSHCIEFLYEGEGMPICSVKVA